MRCRARADFGVFMRLTPQVENSEERDDGSSGHGFSITLLGRTSLEAKHLGPGALESAWPHSW